MGKIYKYKLSTSKQLIIQVISLSILIIFLYTSINKFKNIEYIAYSIRNYPIYSYILSIYFSSYIISYIIILLEISLVAFFLIFRLRLALHFSIGILTFYSANLLSLIIENSYFNCGCGLFYLTSSPYTMLIVDFVLISLIFSLLKWFIDRNDRERLFARIFKPVIRMFY